MTRSHFNRFSRVCGGNRFVSTRDISGGLICRCRFVTYWLRQLMFTLILIVTKVSSGFMGLIIFTTFDGHVPASKVSQVILTHVDLITMAGISAFWLKRLVNKNIASSLGFKTIRKIIFSRIIGSLITLPAILKTMCRLQQTLERIVSYNSEPVSRLRIPDRETFGETVDSSN